MLQVKKLRDALDEVESEPRSDSKLLRIKKALESDYKKNILELVDKDEVDLLKLYFNRILNGPASTINEIIPILDEYIEESTNQPYSDVVLNIKVELTTKQIPLDEFLDFIEKFIGQDYPIDIFFKKFFKRSPLPQIEKPIKPSLTDLFGDELEDLSSSEESDTESEKIRTIKRKIEEKREEQKPIQVIPARQEKRRGRIALVKDVPIPQPRIPEPKPIADKIFFETMTDLTKQDCEFLYKKIPWVKDVVNHIYVHPIEGDFKDILDFENFIIHDNVKFYQPKEKYYSIQCHSHKVQEGHKLTVIKNEDIYKLMVAIDTNTKGIVLQNEDMLKAEIDYVRVWNQNKNEHIKELKQNKPNEDMILLAKFDLSNALVDSITGNVPVIYRSINSKFIETVVNTILKNSNSGESFVRLLANIIIFLKINLSFITSSVFVKRLREQIYLPGTLPFLTDKDKLPEIFLVKNVPDDTKAFVLKKLEEERSFFTKNFFENLYIGSSMIRKPTKPILWNKPTQQIELPDIKTICKNREEVEHENDEDIVFYTDFDEVYCFNVFKLYDLFQKEEIPLNPYTNRPFSDKFIQVFLTRYASKPLVKKIETTQHVDLTSRLEQLIEQELSRLENNLIEIDNPDFIERFNSSINPKEQVKNITIINDKNDLLNKCVECKGTLGPDKISSVFRNKEVVFCGYNCLEKNKAFK